MSKTFQLGDVLSVTDGHLMTSIHNVYAILDYMTGENLFTHQLPRAARVCAPYLLKQFPQLKDVKCEEITPDNWRGCLDSLVKQFGDKFEVEPLPKGAYTAVDPITEAEIMMKRNPN
jgi:hypothetical protein